MGNTASTLDSPANDPHNVVPYPYHAVYYIAVFGEPAHVEMFNLNASFSSTQEHLFGAFVLLPLFQNVSKGLSNHKLLEELGQERPEYPLIVNWLLYQVYGDIGVRHFFDYTGLFAGIPSELQEQQHQKAIRTRTFTIPSALIPIIPSKTKVPVRRPVSIPYFQLSLDQDGLERNLFCGNVWMYQDTNLFSQLVPLYGLKPGLPALPYTFTKQPYKSEDHDGSQTDYELFGPFSYPKPAFFYILPTRGLHQSPFQQPTQALTHFVASIIVLDCASSLAHAVIDDYIKQTADVIVRGGSVDYFKEEIFILLLNADKIDQSVISQPDIIATLTQNGFNEDLIHCTPVEMSPNTHILRCGEDFDRFHISSPPTAPRITSREALNRFLRPIWLKVYEKHFNLGKNQSFYDQTHPFFNQIIETTASKNNAPAQLYPLGETNHKTIPFPNLLPPPHLYPKMSLIAYQQQYFVDVPYSIFNIDWPKALGSFISAYKKQTRNQPVQMMPINDLFRRIYTFFSTLFGGYPTFPPLAMGSMNDNEPQNKTTKETQLKPAAPTVSPFQVGIHPWNYAPIGAELFKLLDSTCPPSSPNRANCKVITLPVINPNNHNDQISLILAPMVSNLTPHPYPDLFRQQFGNSVWNRNVEMYYSFPFRHRSNPYPAQYGPTIQTCGCRLSNQYRSALTPNLHVDEQDLMKSDSDDDDIFATLTENTESSAIPQTAPHPVTIETQHLEHGTNQSSSPLLPYGELPTKYEFESFLLWNNTPLISDPHNTFNRGAFYPLHSSEAKWILNPSSGINSKEYCKMDQLQRCLLLTTPFFHRQASPHFGMVLGASIGTNPLPPQAAIGHFTSERNKVYGLFLMASCQVRDDLMGFNSEREFFKVRYQLNKARLVGFPMAPIFKAISPILRSIHPISRQLGPFHTRCCWIYQSEKNKKKNKKKSADDDGGHQEHSKMDSQNSKTDSHKLNVHHPPHTHNNDRPNEKSNVWTPSDHSDDDHDNQLTLTPQTPQINLTYITMEGDVTSRDAHIQQAERLKPLQVHPCDPQLAPNLFLHGVIVIPFIYTNTTSRDFQAGFKVTSPSTHIFSQPLVVDPVVDVGLSYGDGAATLSNGGVSNYPPHFIPPPIPSFFLDSLLPLGSGVHYTPRNGFSLPAEIVVRNTAPDPEDKDAVDDHNRTTSLLAQHEIAMFRVFNPLTTECSLNRNFDVPFTSTPVTIEKSLLTALSHLNCPISIVILCLNPVIDDPVPYHSPDSLRSQQDQPVSDPVDPAPVHAELEPITRSQFRYFSENIPAMYHHQVINHVFFPFFTPTDDVHEKLHLLWEFKFIHFDDFRDTVKQAEDDAIEQRLRIYREWAKNQGLQAEMI